MEGRKMRKGKAENAGQFVTRAEFEKLSDTVYQFGGLLVKMSHDKIKENDRIAAERKAGEKRRDNVFQLVKK
jgi:hypothetical protein